MEKTAGDTVNAATVNRTGSFTFRATRVGADTSLAKIIQLVEDANATKAPIARMADKVAGVFVPVVFVISAVTFVAWMVLTGSINEALTSAVAVLVISCPCALGLATPVAIMVGTGKGAEMGILFKSAEALENLRSVGTVVLDKTGTVTRGKPAVTDIVVATRADGSPAMSEKALLKLAVALERSSEHPLAEAIMAECEARGIVARMVEDFAAVPGRGVTAREGQNVIAAGNVRLMDELGVKVPAGLAEQFDDCYFTNHYSSEDTAPAVQNFVAKYTEKYGTESLNACAALYYDAIYMLLQAAENGGGTDTTSLVKGMTGMEFTGVGGKIKLDENGDAIKSIAFNTFVDGKVKWSETLDSDGNLVSSAE